MKRNTNHRAEGLNTSNPDIWTQAAIAHEKPQKETHSLKALGFCSLFPLHFPSDKAIPNVTSPWEKPSLPLTQAEVPPALYHYCSVLCTNIAKFFVSSYKIMPGLHIGLPMGNTTFENRPVCIIDLGEAKVSGAQWTLSSLWLKTRWLSRTSSWNILHSLRTHTRFILRHPCPSVAISFTPLIFF